ncbi:MAG: tRNA (adenosine(37)-N6)-threonylcarbamoyltransferase complex ATPase subunit type 1 TsaE [Acutalibacteraceae bacterium]
MKSYITHSPEETEHLAALIADRLHGNETLAMFGGLGVGKTAFTRGLAKGLGIDDGVSSPTFAIVNEYEGRFPVHHFDMYRITSWDDLYATGFFDYLENGITVIEWSENVETALPENAIIIRFEVLSEFERKITIHAEEEYLP